MSELPAPLPEDVQSLHRLLRQQQAQLVHYQAENRRLREQLNLLLARHYGRSSEKARAGVAQMGLFNEAECAFDADTAQAPAHEAEPTVDIPSHTRARGKRQRLPECLERVECRHELPEDQRLCPRHGVALKVIGEEVSEQLDIIPAKVQVIRHVRVKYAALCCEADAVHTVPLPPQPIPKSIAAPGLLAHIAVAKFQDALPLYRQEAILERAGLGLPRATTARWMIRCAALVQPLLNLLEDVLLGYDVLSMDETTVQVLKEPGRAAATLSYLWARRGGPPNQPVILFHYAPSRGHQVPETLLAGYQGYLQVDGYQGYERVGAWPEVTLVGCWAHARRGFTDALKGQGKQSKPGKAQEALAFIQALYALERQADEGMLTPEQRRGLRQSGAQPILEELHAWLEVTVPQVPPQTLLGQALGYLHNQWPSLQRYLEDGRLPIDNNRTENAIRPFVIGRRNWLFCDTPSGAHASAALYSLIETAKANGHEPYAYLRYVFTHLPRAATVEDFEALLPFNTAPAGLRTT